jgi:hypothetical protein
MGMAWRRRPDAVTSLRPTRGEKTTGLRGGNVGWRPAAVDGRARPTTRPGARTAPPAVVTAVTGRQQTPTPRARNLKRPKTTTTIRLQRHQEDYGLAGTKNFPRSRNTTKPLTRLSKENFVNARLSLLDSLQLRTISGFPIYPKN